MSSTDSPNYFVADMKTPQTGPLSKQSHPLSFLNITVNTEGDPIIVKDDSGKNDTDTAPVNTGTVQIPNSMGNHDGDRFVIPKATDLSDPAQLAVWYSIGSTLNYEYAFEPRDDGKTRHFAVFEVEDAYTNVKTDEHGVRQYDNDYAQHYTRVVDADPHDEAWQESETRTEWDTSVAPPYELPDAQPLSKAETLITYHNGRSLPAWGMYGVSAATTTPLAVRDVLNTGCWSWEPETHRVSHVSTFTFTDLCGSPDPDVPEIV